MIWIITIQTLLISVMGYMIWDLRKALRTMIEMWTEEKNKQWLESLEKSGAEIIRIDEQV